VESDATTVIVIPCFNEEARLDPEAVRALLVEGVRVILVDDGSRDGTAALLRRVEAENPGRVRALILPRNGGKGEAVRQGMRAALDDGAWSTGYVDADFATPPSEILRLRAEFVERGAEVVLGSRVRRLGSHIDRRPARHYLGRIFATAASLALGIAVYDTQCGAKIFRDSPALRAALAAPFTSRWAFDVELLGRLLRPTSADVPPLTAERMIEVPLRAWRDVAGSKLRGANMLKAGLDLARIGVRARAR
jgi:glycosyltransferase involved in cell wall biosynthesis